MSLTCPICTEDIKGNEHKLECGHCFHTCCIVKWFRTGSSSCPMCRSKDTDSMNLSFMDIDVRSNMLRKMSRRKSAPGDLKVLVRKLKEAENQRKEHMNELKEFRREYKDLIKKYRNLQNRRWSDHRKISRSKKKLGLYTNSEFKIPILVRKNWGRRSFEYR